MSHPRSELEKRVKARPFTVAEIDAAEAIREAGLQLLIAINQNAPSGRSCALAMTAAEEAVMWGVKAISVDSFTGDADHQAQRVTLGQNAYRRYAMTTGGKTFDGRDMPAWDDLTPTIQQAWIAAGTF